MLFSDSDFSLEMTDSALSCDSKLTSFTSLPDVKEGGVHLLSMRLCLLASLFLSLLSRFRSPCLLRLRLPLVCSRPFLVSPQSRPFRCRSNRGDPTLPLGGVLPPDVAVSLSNESTELSNDVSNRS